jgi:hypothetical protein
MKLYFHTFKKERNWRRETFLKKTSPIGKEGWEGKNKIT